MNCLPKQTTHETGREEGVRKVEISVSKIEGRCCLHIGNEDIPVNDYKISSSMQGGTELEIIIQCDDEIMEFSTLTSRG